MASSNQSKREYSRLQRHLRWDSKHSKVIVYDPCSHELKTEDWNTVESKYETFPVPLPLWRNRVDIYAYPETEKGFIATVQLVRLGFTQNLERRLGKNSRIMLVKGKKPASGSMSASTSAASIDHMKDALSGG